MENVTISLELMSVIKSTMTIQDVAFIWDENMPKKGNFRCDYKQIVLSNAGYHYNVTPSCRLHAIMYFVFAL